MSFIPTTKFSRHPPSLRPSNLLTLKPDLTKLPLPILSIATTTTITATATAQFNSRNLDMEAADAFTFEELSRGLTMLMNEAKGQTDGNRQVS